MTFVEGDVVELKSGGPAMTIDKFTSPDSVTCKWFDGQGVCQVRAFKMSTLKKVSAKS